MKLGDVATLDLPLARAKCLAVRGAVAEGRDPAQEATVAVAVRVEARARERTCAEFADEYLTWFDGRAVKIKTKVDERRQVTQALALIGAQDLPPGELRRSHMMGVLDQLRSPAKARKVFGSLSSFLAYLVDREVITVNPATQIDRRRRPKAPKARSRFLSLPELGAVYRAAGELSSVRGQVIDKAAWSRQARFAVLIPARIGEVAGMLWGHVDLKAGLWAQPGQLVKNGSAHTFALPAAALGLLEEQRAALLEAGLKVGPADRVWLGAKGGDAFHVWGCMLPRLQEHSGVVGWSWDHLRRTCVSHLSEAGVAESTADALLNHRTANSPWGHGVVSVCRPAGGAACCVGAVGKHCAECCGRGRGNQRLNFSSFPLPFAYTRDRREGYTTFRNHGN